MKSLLTRHHPSFRSNRNIQFRPRSKRLLTIPNTPGSTWIFNGSANDEVGSFNGGTSPASGQILWSLVRDGIDGDSVSFFDVRSTPLGSTQITDAIGNVWNLQGNAAVVAYSSIPVQVRIPTARRSNVIDYDNDGADKPVTGLAVIGQGEGDDQKLFFIQQTLGDIPLWEGKITLKDQSENQLLIDRGNFCLSSMADVNRQYTVEIDSELPPFHEDLRAGDFIRTVINDKFTQEDGLFWVGRMRVTLSKQQDEQITLEITQ